MSEQFWATILGALIPTVPALLALVTARAVKKDVAATREQVQNDHPKNMREEQDERHAENQRALKWLARELLALGEKVEDAWAVIRDNRHRITDLEDTEQRNRAAERSAAPLRRDRRPRPIQITDLPGYEDRAPWENTEIPK